jgi:hypothetical protein
MMERKYIILVARVKLSCIISPTKGDKLHSLAPSYRKRKLVIDATLLIYKKLVFKAAG